MTTEEKDKKELEVTTDTKKEGTENTEQQKPFSIEGYFEEERKKAKEAKTSAVNMQKYHALANALNAIGKMGGAVVGGALQGNNLWGNAPAVGEYKPSRGYIQAFEDAKDASKRLQSIEDKGFELALRDDERKYNATLLKEEREYKDSVRSAEQDYNTKMQKAKNDWDKEFFLLKAQIEQAYAQKNMQLANELKAKLEEAQRAHELNKQQIQHTFDEKMKKINQAIVDKQTSPKADTPLAFNDGTSALIPRSIYNKMAEHFEGSDWNGGKVTNGNVLKFIEENPKIANDYLNRFGYGVKQPASTKAPDVTGQTGESKNYDYLYRPNLQGAPYNYVEVPTDVENKWGSNVVKVN